MPRWLGSPEGANRRAMSNIFATYLVPIAIGAVAIVLVMLGLHLRRQGQAIAAERNAPRLPSSQAETLQYKGQK